MVVSTPPNGDTIYKMDQHITQLDGVRGLAVLLVTLYRFGRDVPVNSPLSAFSAQAFEVGHHGVELFFVLSGFLITGILLNSRGAEHQLTSFFMRRSVRILPLYFAALIVCVWLIPVIAKSTSNPSLAQAFAPAHEHQFYLWLYLTNLYMSWQDSWCFGPLDHFWSLAVEEHFYLIWPLVVCYCSPRKLAWVTLSGIAMCWGLRTTWCALGWNTTVTDVHTIMRCDGLLLGAWLAIQVRAPGGLLDWRGLASRALWPLLALAIVCDVTDRRMLMLGNCLWTLMWCCLLILLVTSRPGCRLASLFNAAPLRQLGKVSYAMYIIQSPLIPVMAALFAQFGSPFSMDNLPAYLLYVGGMFTVTYALALCSWHGFEKHWLGLKKYFPTPEARLHSGQSVDHPVVQEKQLLSPR